MSFEISLSHIPTAGMSGTHSCWEFQTWASQPDVSPEVIGRQVVTALIQVVDELEAGALLTIDPNWTRFRLLPFRTRD